MDVMITFDGDDFAKKEVQLFFAVLSTLSHKEQNKLSTFLDSPYFNTDKLILPLYLRLRDSYRNQSRKAQLTKAPRINGKPLLKAIFKGIEEKEAKQKLKFSLKELGRLSLTFIEHQELKTDEQTKLRVRTTALKKRSSTPLFEETAETLERILDKPEKTIMVYQEYWWLFHQLYFHQYTQHYHEKSTERLSNVIRYQSLLCQLASLRYYCEILNRKKIVGDENKFKVLENQSDEFIEENSSLPLVAIYSRLARVLQDIDNQKKYEHLKVYYQNYHSNLAKPDQLVIIKNMFNVWIRHYEVGNDNGPKELLFWAREGLEREAFLFEGNISDKEYINIVMAAGIAEELDFLNTFTEDYKIYLEEEKRDKAYYMAIIYSHFIKNQLSEVLNLLKKHFPKNKQVDYAYTLRAKIFYVLTYLMCKLQMNDKLSRVIKCEEAFDREIASFRKYILRAKFLDKDRKAPYHRFANICQNIYDYDDDIPDRQTQAIKKKLIRKIKKKVPLVARFVLLKLANQLKTQ